MDSLLGKCIWVYAVQEWLNCHHLHELSYKPFMVTDCPSWAHWLLTSPQKEAVGVSVNGLSTWIANHSSQLVVFSALIAGSWEGEGSVCAAIGDPYWAYTFWCDWFGFTNASVSLCIPDWFTCWIPRGNLGGGCPFPEWKLSRPHMRSIRAFIAPEEHESQVTALFYSFPFRLCLEHKLHLDGWPWE